MRVPRVFVAEPLAAGQSVQLDAEHSHHLSSVLRLQPGDAVRLFDGGGKDWISTIRTIGKRLNLHVGDSENVNRESCVAITLWQGLSQSSRMDACLRQAVELGVSAFRPIATRRSQTRLDARRAEKRLAHWHSIAISACEQSGRAVVPQVYPLMDLASALRTAPDACAGDTLSLLLHPDADAALGDVGDVGDVGGDARGTTIHRIDLLIGPESGLDEREVLAAIAAGFTAVRAGPRVLRTETAGPAALAVLQARFGDLNT